MKVGDVVRCTDDPETIFGCGLVTQVSTRMVLVWWPEDGDKKWYWKGNLELVNGN